MRTASGGNPIKLFNLLGLSLCLPLMTDYFAGGLKSSSNTTSDCTSLKNAILNAKVVEGFLCLLDGECFPVSASESTNIIPSKLLIRDFHPK